MCQSTRGDGSYSLMLSPSQATASTSHPHPSHCKVHGGPCGALEDGEAGGEGEVPLVVPSYGGKVRMNGSH